MYFEGGIYRVCERIRYGVREEKRTSRFLT
jgi:hypothetical protein